MTLRSSTIPALMCVLAAGGVLAAQQVQTSAGNPAETHALAPAPTAPAPEVNEYTDGTATSTSAASVNSSGVSQVRIVRLSQVMGKVQMDRNTRAGFEPTFANLPIVQGTKLKTLDGVAEVEFEDNSSLRIAPDSLLEINRLGRDTAGTTSNNFNLAQGTMYLSLAPTKGNDFVIRSGDETFTISPASHVRLDVYPAGSELKVFKGAVEVKDATGSYQVAKGKVFQFGGQAAVAPRIAKNDEPGLYDKWDQQSVDYHAVSINAQSYAGNGFQYGMNDLNYYGAFSNVAGCGNVWQPYFTSANWNPYGSGMWAFYPGAGYSFVSPYPWGLDAVSLGQLGLLRRRRLGLAARRQLQRPEQRCEQQLHQRRRGAEEAGHDAHAGNRSADADPGGHLESAPVGAEPVAEVSVRQRLGRFRCAAFGLRQPEQDVAAGRGARHGGESLQRLIPQHSDAHHLGGYYGDRQRVCEQHAWRERRLAGERTAEPPGSGQFNQQCVELQHVRFGRHPQRLGRRQQCADVARVFRSERAFGFFVGWRLAQVTLILRSLGDDGIPRSSR